METITFNPPKTKQCPFCAETIQARAIKCRFCSEFLNTEKAKKALQAGSNPNSDQPKQKKRDKVLFEGRPSLWGMTPAVIKGSIFLALAILLMSYPLEELPIFQQTENPGLPAYDVPTEPVPELPVGDALAEPLPESEITENPAEVEETSRFTLSDQQVLLFHRYRIVAGLGLTILIVLILLIKMLKLKMTRYEVSAERIEWSRGIFDRRIDNLDMFRVLDLKLRRSLLDCIVGVGTVGLITTDKTDPEFTFEKIRNSRRLYDIIKKASLDADRRTGVVHIE